MRAELTNLNHCAVSLLNRAAVNLSSYDSITYRHKNIRLLLQNLFWFTVKGRPIAVSELVIQPAVGTFIIPAQII